MLREGGSRFSSDNKFERSNMAETGPVDYGGLYTMRAGISTFLNSRQFFYVYVSLLGRGTH